MFRKSSRKIWKQALVWTKIKLIYTRITLTKFTTFYFFLALINCIILVSLQAVTFADNVLATNLIADVLEKGNITTGLTIYRNHMLQTCDDLPGRSGSNCRPIPGTQISGRDAPTAPFGGSYRDAGFISPLSSRDVTVVSEGQGADTIVVLDNACLESLLWLKDILHDSGREDLVTLAFQIWLFTLAVVTILNESLPHLAAAVFGHILGMAWAAFRVTNFEVVERRYRSAVVHRACDNIDLMGNWWDVKASHTIPIVVMNVVALLTASFFSFKLFKVYASQSFSRVGASPHIHKIYKLVLCLSVSLQMAGFFAMASTAMWLDKLSHLAGSVNIFHIAYYRAGFIVMVVLELPWIVLGWISVRRECRVKFIAFCAVSAVLFGISTALFTSPLYQFIFSVWPFFATMTVTAYIFIVITSLLGIACRLHFGKGLSQFLQVTDALEGVDFTPVYFSKDEEKPPLTTMNRPSFSRNSLSRKLSRKWTNDAGRGTNSTADVVHISALPYVQEPPPTYQGNAHMSVYSDSTRETVKLSSTPPLARSDSPISTVPIAPLKSSLSVRSTSSSKSRKVLAAGGDIPATFRASSLRRSRSRSTPEEVPVKAEPLAYVLPPLGVGSSMDSSHNKSGSDTSIRVQPVAAPMPTSPADSPTTPPGVRGKGLPSNPRPRALPEKEEPRRNFF